MRETLRTILCLLLLALPLAGWAGCAPQEEPAEEGVGTEEEFDVDAAEVTPEEEEMQRQEEQEQMEPPPQEQQPLPPPEEQPQEEPPPPPPPGSGR